MSSAYDAQVVEDWDAAEDSEEEAEKAKKAAAAKAKAEEEARLNHKSRSQRIEEKRMANMRKKMEEEEESSSEEEDDAERRERLRLTEQAADMKHAEDLFTNVGVKDRSAPKAFVATDSTGGAKTVDLSSLPLLKPNTKDQFAQLRTTLAPLLAASSKKGPYPLFLQDFVKDITRDLPSEQIKKIGSALMTLSNEKMKEEKAAEKGGKKSKAKAKATLVASRGVSSRADTTAYEDNLEE